MNTRTLLTSLFAFAVMATSGMALAQSADVTRAAPASDKQYISQYAEGATLMLQGHADMMKALGLKDKAVTIQAYAESIPNAEHEDDLFINIKQVLSSNNKIIAATQNKGVALSAADKNLYAQGLASAAKGYREILAMKGITAPHATNKINTKAIKFISKTLPKQTAELGEALHGNAAYAHSNNIPIHKDAAGL
jgi:predicted nucleotidyltransferase